MSRTGSALLLLLLTGAPALAQEPGSAPDEPDEPDEDELPLPAVPLPVANIATAPVPVPRLYVGAHVGASFALAALGPGVTPSIEAGGLIGPDGRFQPFLSVSYTEAHATGTAEDPAFPDGYTWTLARRSTTVAPGLRVRLLPWRERLSPEFAAGPLLDIASITVGGASGDAAFPETTEARVAGGGFVSAGLAGRLGPGQLEGHVTLCVVPETGDLTGSLLLPTLAPSIGYRVTR
jgi:hypothetical protein